MSIEHNLNLRSEDELLLYCARTNIDSEIENRILSLVQENLDWDYLVKTALAHGLIPLFYSNINYICPETVPNYILEKLKYYFNQIMHNNLLLTRELIKILKLLKTENIDVIPYKGPTLAVLAYGNVSFRQFGDLDVFIPKKYVQKVVKILNLNGYVSQLNLKDSQEIAFLKYQREYKLINIENKIPIEIKWKIPVSSFSFKSDFEDAIFDSDIKSINFFNYQIFNLSNEHLLLILCIHNVGHYWTQLKWICDISEFIKANSIDWSLVIDKANRLGIARILYVNLFLSRELLDLKLPLEIEKALELDKSVKNISTQIIERVIFNSNQLKFYEKVMIRLRIRESISNKIKDFLNLMLVPTPHVIKNIKLPVFFFKIYYLLRFIDVISRYTIYSLKTKL